VPVAWIFYDSALLYMHCSKIGKLISMGPYDTIQDKGVVVCVVTITDSEMGDQDWPKVRHFYYSVEGTLKSFGGIQRFTCDTNFAQILVTCQILGPGVN
jgi:hypothetical protein